MLAALTETILFAFSNEEPTPSWVPAVALAVPIVIMLAVLIPALRKRAKHKRVRRAQRSGRGVDDTPLGSHLAIEDGGNYSHDALLKAMAIKPEDHGPTREGDPHDEGWAGTMLGLKSRISYATDLLEPHLYWGKHDGRQVFVRLGPDEKIAGGTELYSNRHIRIITVVRVAAREFAIESVAGRLTASDTSPTEIAGLLAGIAPSEGVWTDLRVYGGPQGIVAWRPAITADGSWAYDLWLCERIARVLKLEPLPDARIGPEWEVPYKLGRKFDPQP